MSAESRSRLVKILGFEMKVLVALVTDYVEWLGDCVTVIYQLAVDIQRPVYALSLCHQHALTWLF